MTNSGDVAIERVDVRALPIADVARLTTFMNVMQAEREPEDPYVPVELVAAQLRSIPAFIDVAAFLARLDDEVVGVVQAIVLNIGTNEHLAQVSLSVRPDCRNRGLGRELLARITPAIREQGRRLLIADTSDRAPAGDAFATRVGATAGMQVHVNRLRSEDVDRAQMERWVADAGERAAAYSLMMVDGPIPETIVEPFLDLVCVMNDSPREGLDIEDGRPTSQELRASEQAAGLRGTERWTAIVRHDETGALVGVHDVSWNPALPGTVEVGMTGVRREHRGHALGKWLKAAMTLRILDERPGVVDIRTGNAYSNEAMLGINTEMGYRHHVRSTVWQVDVDTVDRYLAGGGLAPENRPS